MKIKVWDVLQGPVAVEDSDLLAPEGSKYFMICRAEVDGEMCEDTFWFEDFNDAYEWETYFHNNIDPIVIDMGQSSEYN